MQQIPNTISAEELFGHESQIVEQAVGNTLRGVASLGVWYQIVAAVVALLFVFVVVNYFTLFRHLIVTSFGKQKERSGIQLFESEIKNVKIATSLIGAVLISLLVMRLSVEEWLAPVLAPISHLSAWELGGATLAGILIVMCGERLLLYAVGVVGEQVGACNEIWSVKLLYFSIAVALLSPMIILTLLTEHTTAHIALSISVAVCLLSLILFIKETFLLFRTQRFSIFHWFLYLCALELFPLSLLLAPIARG